MLPSRSCYHLFPLLNRSRTKPKTPPFSTMDTGAAGRTRGIQQGGLGQPARVAASSAALFDPTGLLWRGRVAPTGALVQRPTECLRQAGVAWERAGLRSPLRPVLLVQPKDGESSMRSHPASPFGCTLQSSPCTPTGPGMPVAGNAPPAGCLAWSDALRRTETGG